MYLVLTCPLSFSTIPAEILEGISSLLIAFRNKFSIAFLEEVPTPVLSGIAGRKSKSVSFKKGGAIVIIPS